MSSQRGDRAASLSTLCLACGMCCDGNLFTQVPLAEEEAVRLRGRGLVAGGAGKATLVAACAYFALIGLGFMFVEIGLLSRVGVFLGHSHDGSRLLAVGVVQGLDSHCGGHDLAHGMAGNLGLI